jgi:hypothetical protein
MRVGKKKIRWPSELAKRIRVERPQGLSIIDPETVAKANEEMTRLAAEAVTQRLREKLRFLMAHYSIADRDNWFHLAVALATDHVPGFQVEWPLVELPPDFQGPVITERKRGGRPTEWDFDRLERLLVAVEQEKARQGLSTDREALSRLARRREWARPATHRGDLQSWIETLETRLQEAKKFKRLLEQTERDLKDIERQITAENSGNSKRV